MVESHAVSLMSYIRYPLVQSFSCSYRSRATREYGVADKSREREKRFRGKRKSRSKQLAGQLGRPTHRKCIESCCAYYIISVHVLLCILVEYNGAHSCDDDEIAMAIISG